MVKNLPAMQQTRVHFLGGEKSPGEGNGNPVWHSCLVNSMDRVAWRATVHGVTNSWTWLSNFHFLFIYLHSLAYYLLLSCRYRLISSTWLLIHWKGKAEAADSKHLFSRVSGKIFATSAELYVYINMYYFLRENINKSIHLKEVCANRGFKWEDWISWPTPLNVSMGFSSHLFSESAWCSAWFKILYQRHIICAEDTLVNKTDMVPALNHFFLTYNKFSINISCYYYHYYYFPDKRNETL